MVKNIYVNITLIFFYLKITSWWQNPTMIREIMQARKIVNLPLRVWEVRKQVRNNLGKDSQELGRRLTWKRKKRPRNYIILCLVKQERRKNKYGVNKMLLSTCVELVVLRKN